MIGRRALSAAALLPLALAACDHPQPKSAEPAANAAQLDRYLDRYRLLRPARLPDADEAAAGCDDATSNAIADLEAGGAMVERSLESTAVRKLECRWASDRAWIASCRFEMASIPFAPDPASDADRRASIALLRDRDWEPGAARFALVQLGGLASGSDSPRWVATDTCQPFVFRGDNWEVDLREMIRKNRRGN